MRWILITLFLLTSLLSFGQFIKGDKFIRGTFNLNSQNTPDSNTGGFTNSGTSFSIYPSIGFLLNEKFAIGGQIGFSSSYSKSTNGSSYIVESNSLSISSAIFANRYFKISDKFLFSLVGAFAFNRGTSTNITTDKLTSTITEYKTENYAIRTSIRPSFIFFPTPKWGFEVGIGSISHSYNMNLSTGENSNIFNLNYGTLSWGLLYYFKKSGQTKN